MDKEVLETLALHSVLLLSPLLFFFSSLIIIIIMNILMCHFSIHYRAHGLLHSTKYDIHVHKQNQTQRRNRRHCQWADRKRWVFREDLKAVGVFTVLISRGIVFQTEGAA